MYVPNAAPLSGLLLS